MASSADKIGARALFSTRCISLMVKLHASTVLTGVRFSYTALSKTTKEEWYEPRSCRKAD